MIWVLLAIFVPVALLVIVAIACDDGTVYTSTTVETHRHRSIIEADDPDAEGPK